MLQQKTSQQMPARPCLSDGNYNRGEAIRGQDKHEERVGATKYGTRGKSEPRFGLFHFVSFWELPRVSWANQKKEKGSFLLRTTRDIFGYFLFSPGVSNCDVSWWIVHLCNLGIIIFYGDFSLTLMFLIYSVYVLYDIDVYSF